MKKYHLNFGSKSNKLLIFFEIRSLWTLRISKMSKPLAMDKWIKKKKIKRNFKLNYHTKIYFFILKWIFNINETKMWWRQHLPLKKGNKELDQEKEANIYIYVYINIYMYICSFSESYIFYSSLLHPLI